jgi:hypothetical protein
MGQLISYYFFNLLSMYFCCRNVCKALDHAMLNVEPFGKKFRNDALKISKNNDSKTKRNILTIQKKMYL